MALSSKMKIWFLALFLLFCSFVSSKRHVAYVTLDSKDGLKIRRGQNQGQDLIGTATFADYIQTTGWAVLEVTTNPNYDDALQAYAAGLMEADLTRELIAKNWNNTIDGYCKKPYAGYCARLQKFLQDNLEWVYHQIASQPNDPYWHQVELLLTQVNGLIDGYTSKVQKPSYKITDPFGFYFFQIGGDLEDLESALKKEDKTHLLGSGSCSALVKLLPGNKELFMSHDTWSGFQSMLRIQKRYQFGFHHSYQRGSQQIPGNNVSFSSYPGKVFSGDDFYATSAGLGAQETTIGNSNADLWSKVTSSSVLENFRSMVANRLAVSGKEWTDTFKKYNSGTYNNQWMIVDYKKFTPGNASSQDLLWVLEQIPGTIMAADVSNVLLKQGYWGSYNIPYFPKIFNASGVNDLVKKFGDWFSYENGPRAKIFRRDHGKVVDMETMVHLMRYNDFKNDPVSRCNCTPPYSGENAISARSDLNPASGTYPFGALGHRLHGGTDMKVTSSILIKKLEFVAISGPTYTNLPPFQWSTSDFKDVRHEGLPDLWKFPVVQYDWDSKLMTIAP
ncbi:putative phospholipase B-like 2 [Lineus longissimus]|uniref:putative phospholipase B-like 2 n=1 Tax=Lineus longissimus TaxID=88925 RepID=UPI002B4CCEFA